MNNHRFLIACGGTGGHFYPGLALGLALREKGKEVLFLVRQNEPSIQTLLAHKLPYREIDLCGLPRSVNPMRHFTFAKKLISSLRRTRQIVRDFQPDVALGTGGYISFPLLCVARLKNIKTAVHDSNSRLGLVNRLCGRFATLFMLGLPIDKKLKNGVLVSTPLRPEFLQTVTREEVFQELNLNPTVPTILVVGGSQGAKGLNEAVISCAKNCPQYQFIHISGNKWFEPLQQAYQNCPHVRLLAYSHTIYKLMKSADLTLCRSGAGTLAELIACRLPAVLVPFPHAAADHQYYNAKVLEEVGAAVVLRESPQLAHQLQRFLEQTTPEKLQQMRAAYEKLTLDPVHAADKITEMLISL